MEFEQEQILEQVSVETDEQLLNLIQRRARGKKIRTYPSSRDRHQQALHAAVQRLVSRGAGQLSKDYGSSLEWQF